MFATAGTVEAAMVVKSGILLTGDSKELRADLAIEGLNGVAVLGPEKLALVSPVSCSFPVTTRPAANPQLMKRVANNRRFTGSMFLIYWKKKAPSELISLLDRSTAYEISALNLY